MPFRRSMTSRLAGLALLLAGFAAVLPQAAQAQSSARSAATPGGDWAICAETIALEEQARPELPEHLLSAIAKTESRRWNEEYGAGFSWPWTVMAEGRGRYLPSKAAAIAEVRQLHARGISNIDVGCMQVNLHYHGDNFASLEEALDPRTNVRYAADFLTGLYADSGAWTRAIGDYHSQTPRYSGPYRQRVFTAWRETREAVQTSQRAQRRARAEMDYGLAEPLRDPGLLLTWIRG